MPRGNWPVEETLATHLPPNAKRLSPYTGHAQLPQDLKVPQPSWHCVGLPMRHQAEAGTFPTAKSHLETTPDMVIVNGPRLSISAGKRLVVRPRQPTLTVLVDKSPIDVVRMSQGTGPAPSPAHLNVDRAST